MTNNLQLYRNTTPFDSKELAMAALQGKLKESVDGEIVLARYYSSVSGDPRPVETIFGIAYDADRSAETNNAQYTIYDSPHGITSADINGITANIENGKMTLIIPAKNINLSDYEIVDLGSLNGVKLTSILVNDNINIAFNTVEKNLKKIVTAINTNKDTIDEIYNATFPLSVNFSATPTLIEANKGTDTDITLSWNVILKGVDITSDSVVKLDDNIVTGKSTKVKLQLPTPTTKTYKLNVEYNGRIKDTSVNVSASYNSYFGVVNANFEVNEQNVKTLEKILRGTKSYDRTNINLSNQFILYAYPKSFGNLTTILDGNNFNVTSTYTKSEITIDTIPYLVYKTSSLSTGNNVKQSYR